MPVTGTCSRFYRALPICGRSGRNGPPSTHIQVVIRAVCHYHCRAACLYQHPPSAQ